MGRAVAGAGRPRAPGRYWTRPPCPGDSQMRAATFVLAAVLTLPAAGPKAAGPPPRVVVTSPRATDVVVTQQHPGQIRARRHIEVRALSAGYLEAVPVREGQAVKQGDVL